MEEIIYFSQRDYDKCDKLAHDLCSKGFESSEKYHLAPYKHASEGEDFGIDSAMLDEHEKVILQVELEYLQKPSHIPYPRYPYPELFFIKKHKVEKYSGNKPKSVLIRFFEEGNYCAIVFFDIFHQASDWQVRQVWCPERRKKIDNISAPTDFKYIFYLKTEDVGRFFDLFSSPKKDSIMDILLNPHDLTKKFNPEESA